MTAAHNTANNEASRIGVEKTLTQSPRGGLFFFPNIMRLALATCKLRTALQKINFDNPCWAR